jgi:hypothetical protein
MARIAGAPAGTNPLLRAVYAITRRRLGRMIEPIAIAGHHPRLMLGMGAFEQALQGAHRIDPKLRALAVLKAAGLIGCPF